MPSQSEARARQQPSKTLKLYAGGECGIRTRDTGFSPYNGLANRPLRPLGQLSLIAIKILLEHRHIFKKNFTLKLVALSN